MQLQMYKLQKPKLN